MFFKDTGENFRRSRINFLELKANFAEYFTCKIKCFHICVFVLAHKCIHKKLSYATTKTFRVALCSELTFKNRGSYV